MRVASAGPPAREVRVSLPHDGGWSKNVRLAPRRGRFGEARLSPVARHRRDALAEAVRVKTEAAGIRWTRAPLWVGIRVEHANHRTDAVNVVDLVCDAVQRGTGVDDRWYQLAGVVWEPVHGDDPRIVVALAQADVEDSKVCPECRRLLARGAFGGDRGYCRGCTRARSRAATKRAAAKRGRPPPDGEAERGRRVPWENAPGVGDGSG